RTGIYRSSISALTCRRNNRRAQPPFDSITRKHRHRARLAAVDARFVLALAAGGAEVHGSADLVVVRRRPGAGFRGGPDPAVRAGAAGGAGALLCVADTGHAAAGAVVRDLLRPAQCRHRTGPAAG